MKKIAFHNFKYTIRDIYKNTESRKFCFIIGAGASFKSGIPTGGQLAEKWFKEIKERYTSQEFLNWVKEFDLDEKDLASNYGDIYRKRFENDKISGYEFLVKEMQLAKPSLGHFVLSQILSKTEGNCVLTTNFDSLIESSIYQFTDKTPLVCGHESLSGYARPSKTHPLIIKIHRDLLLSPKSDLAEISSLDVVWEEPLDYIFSNHIPIVIGYGGNDGSLMKYFEKMNKPSNFFWCGYRNSLPSERIVKLVEKLDGNYIEIEGFDEMMKELLWVFDQINPIKEELDAITTSRRETINAQLDGIESKSQKIGNHENEPKKELSAFEYSTNADKEPDFEKRTAIYLEALEHFPKTIWLWAKFTSFLQFEKKDFSKLEEYYMKALTSALEDVNLNGNFATFLTLQKKEYILAEKFYLKALAISPENAKNIGNYANFLISVKRDYVQAEEYYLKALSIAPEDVNLNINYANCLIRMNKDIDKAEEHFLKALANVPENINAFLHYATFLKDKKKDFINAEIFYKRGLDIDPTNYEINGGYAIFLGDIKKDNINAEKHHRIALEKENDNAIINANYASFLFGLNQVDNGKVYFEKAWHLNNNVRNDLLIELWFYKYAHFVDSREESENEILQLLKEGVRSIDWNFEQNINVAIENGHPFPSKLQQFSMQIRTQN